MVSLKQSSLSGGIVSPELLGRSDQNKYATGLRVCQNAWITRYGTYENRPGTTFCGEVKDSSNPVRLVPFIFSQTVSYILELGNDYFRPWRDGSRVVVGAGGTPATAYAGGTTYAQGDFVTYLTLSYRSLVSSNTGHTPDSSPTYWNVQADTLVEVVDAIGQASLSSLQFVQQNDIMTLVQQAFIPQQFLRFSDSKWQQQSFVQSTGIAAPTGIIASAGVPPATTPIAPIGLTAIGGNLLNPKDKYAVTAWSYATASEGPIARATATVGQADGANPVALSWTAVAGADGYAVYRALDPSAIVPVLLGIVAIVSTNSYSDTGTIEAYPVKAAPVGSPGSTTFTYEVTAVSAVTGNESLASSQATCIGGTPTEARPNVITWSLVTGADRYNVYRINNGIPGYIGSVQDPTASFNDTGLIIPDTSIQPPEPLTLFSTSNDYPAVVGYYQQRLGFANTINEPQTVIMSRVGNDYNFTTSTPIQDNDAVSFTIAGKQVQPVRALVDLGKLIIHTNNSEYVASGNQAGALTPLSISLVSQGSAGCGTVPPVTIGNTDLFVQAGATRLIDLRYEVQSFAFTGKDLTKFAPELFKGRTIVGSDWQKLPHSILWCVLDNGAVVALTYTRDGSQDDVIGWHYHSFTNGAAENVAVVPEGTEFAVYFVIRRTIGGVTKRYIERLASRECLDTVLYSDSIFCDSAQVYDGRESNQAVPTTATATTSGGWATTDTITITAGISRFVVGDVGNAVVLQQIDSATGLVTDQVTVNITGYTSDTVVTGSPLQDVPTWAQSVAVTTWGKAVKSFSGIDHLEGQEIAVLADGNVASDPLDDGYPTLTVSGGAFALPDPALVVTAGLPIDMRGQTMPAENAQGETIINKRVSLSECTPIFYNSRGGKFGQDFNHLFQWKQPANPTMGYPVPPYTGPARIPIQGTPQTTGQVCWRLTNPVPFSMSAIVVTGKVGD